jgi:uroporphyrinogen-III synthase
VQVIKILITREIEAATSTAEAVKALGFRPIIYPLIKIEPVPYELPHDFIPDYVIITSINTAYVAIKHDVLLKYPFIIIGEKSADILTRNQFKVSATYIDSNSLLKSIQALKPPLKFLYLSGDHIASDIPQKLTDMGHIVRRVIVYKSCKTSDFALNALNNIEAITFYSPRTARIFYEHITTQSAYSKLSRVTAICMSTNVAKALADLAFKEIKIAKLPTEEYMLKELERLSRKTRSFTSTSN